MGPDSRRKWKRPRTKSFAASRMNYAHEFLIHEYKGGLSNDESNYTRDADGGMG